MVDVKAVKTPTRRRDREASRRALLDVRESTVSRQYRRQAEPA